MKLADALNVAIDVYCGDNEVEHMIDIDDDTSELYFGEVDEYEFITVNVNQEISLCDEGMATITDTDGNVHNARFFVTIPLSSELYEALSE